MTHQRAWAEIDLRHLSHNLRAVRRRMPPGVRLMAAVKADAYGHGAPEVAKALARGGTDAFGVATCEEGIALRESGVGGDILVMGFTPSPLRAAALRYKLTQTVFSAEYAQDVADAAARLDTRADVHIKIDTGMGRLGFPPDVASIETIAAIAARKTLRVTGIYTHFATSDALDNSFMHEQRARFAWVRERLSARRVVIPLWHMGNSGAFAQTLRGPAYADEGVFLDMLRVGVLLYGLLPSSELAGVCAELSLKPVMRLLTQVGMVKTLPAGTGVSYGHMFHTRRETRIATLPVGYADGYPRRLSNRAKVLINGAYAPIAGAVCMDQCMADVTDIPGGVRPGDTAVMLGEPGNTADVLADIVGTIGYEVICGVGKRVPRVVVV